MASHKGRDSSLLREWGIIVLAEVDPQFNDWRRSLGWAACTWTSASHGVAQRAGIIVIIVIIEVIVLFVLIYIIAIIVIIGVVFEGTRWSQSHFGGQRAAIAKRVDNLGDDQFRPAMRTGWLAYIKKTYSADAVQHGHALGQGELVVGDDEWLLVGPGLFCTFNTQPNGDSVLQNNYNVSSNNHNNRQ